MIEEVAVPALAVFAATVAKKSAEAPAHTLNLLWKVTTTLTMARGVFDLLERHWRV